MVLLPIVPSVKLDAVPEAASGRTRRLTLLPSYSVNQMLPSCPRAIPNGSPPAVATGYSVMAPASVIVPILLPPYSANQILPSPPTVMPAYKWFGVGMTNDVSAPVVVIRPITTAPKSETQRLPSGTAVIPPG